jgi:hypothetical protein
LGLRPAAVGQLFASVETPQDHWRDVVAVGDRFDQQMPGSSCLIPGTVVVGREQPVSPASQPVADFAVRRELLGLLGGFPQCAQLFRVRPDRVRRTGNNNVFLMSEDQDVSPTVSVFAAMKSSVAAALLIGVTPEEAAKVFEELPPERAGRSSARWRSWPARPSSTPRGASCLCTASSERSLIRSGAHVPARICAVTERFTRRGRRRPPGGVVAGR